MPFRSILTFLSLSSLSIFSVQAAVFELADEQTTVVGHNLVVYTRGEDTLLDIARSFDLGYSEIVDANPGLDPWVPGADKAVKVPMRFLLPDAPRQGIVINIPEMRLYYYSPKQANGVQKLITHPIGIGREGRDTPLGRMSVIQKRENPSWTPPESVRREYAAAGDILPAVVPPGPDNPLGTRAIRLSNPSYLIHGTHRPFGVGLRVSSGCIRLYPEDIEHLYESVPLNTQVNIIHAPYKAGVHNGQLYLEAHKPMDDLDDRHRNNMTPMVEAILSAKDKLPSEQQWPIAEQVVYDQKGMVTALYAPELSLAEDVWFIHGGLGLRTTPKIINAIQALNLNEWFWTLRNQAENEVILGPFTSQQDAAEMADKISERASVSVWVAQFDKSMI